MKAQDEKWDWKITPATNWLGASFGELIAHKDLLFGIVRKDLLSSYQQTLLGPLWILIQPLFGVIVYMFVFNRIIGVSTQGIPPFLFYLTGITLWNLFADIVLSISNVITNNISVYSKVYFPRLITPLSGLLLQLTRFSIHFIFLCIVLVFYFIKGESDFHFPGLLFALGAVLIAALIAFGSGLLFSVISTKYRDVNSLMSMVIRLLIFVTPVFYSLETVPSKFSWVLQLNPLTAVFELFRTSLTGDAIVMPSLWYSFSFMIIIVAAGVLFFNKMTDKLMDVA